MIRKIAGLLCLIGPLSACLGGDFVSPLEARGLLNRSGDYNALRNRLDGVPNSAFSAVPAAGSASFDGVATLRVGPDNQRTRVVGDLVIDVDFGSGEIEGQMDRFFGVDQTRDLAEYRGGLTINNGSIGDARANAWTADYAGEIRGNGDTIVAQGQLGGDFLGTPIRGLDGRSALDETALVNGVAQDIRIDLVAEN